MISKVYEKVPKDSTDYTYLLMFVYLSDVRVAEKADDFKRNKLEESKSIAKILVAENKISLSDSDIENLDVIIDRPNLSYIQGMENLLSIISELCPMIIINESKLGFITSDVPLAKYHQWFIERDYKHPYGFGHIGFQCFIPLSSKICFCLYVPMFKTNQFFKTAPLPYNEAGPIHIEAFEKMNKLKEPF